MEVDNYFIRDRMLELIDKAGLSDREASLNIGLSNSYFNALRTKKEPNYPLMQNFLDICSYFKITPVEFFETALEDPISARAVYEELKRLGNKGKTERLLKILSVMDEQEFDALLKVFEKYKEAD